MAGKEYCLFRYPIEVAIPGCYVIEVVDMIRSMGHHIELNAAWKTSHIVVNQATQTNNPPTLRDWFKAFAYVGVTYIAFTSNGQRWPVTELDDLESNDDDSASAN